MQICLILFPGVALSQYSAVQIVVAQANRNAGSRIVQIQTRSATTACICTGEGQPLQPDVSNWHGAPGFDLVVLLTGPSPAQPVNMGLRGFLRQAKRAGATLSGIGQGAVVLARMGLLSSYRPALPVPDGTPGNALAARPDPRPATTASGGAAMDLILDWMDQKICPMLASHTRLSLGLGPTPPDGLSRDPLLRHMQEIMLATVANPLPLTELAASLGSSPKQLRLRCQKGLGITPAQACQALRLDLAHHLVIETGQNVAEIAKEAGFASASSFTRAFRARFGHSPRALRKAAILSPSRSAA